MLTSKTDVRRVRSVGRSVSIGGKKRYVSIHNLTKFQGNTGEVHKEKGSLVPRPLPDFYLAAVEKNREKAWDQNYVTDRKWWTRLVRNVDSVCTN